MKQKIILLGAGGHHKVIKEVVQSSESYEVAAVLDDRFEQEEWQGEVLYTSMAALPQWLHADQQPLFVIAIGSNGVRRQLAEKLSRQGARFATIIHPSAIISPSVQIGEGSVVLARAVINADAVLGRHVIVNTGSIVEHDCVIEEYGHLSSGCVVAGGGIVERNVYVKPGTVIMQGERATAESY